MEIRFGVQSADHRTVPNSAQKMENCYLEANVPGGSSQASIIPSFGITEFNNITALSGAAYIAGTFYVVGDNGLYTVSESGAESLKAAFTYSGKSLVMGDAANVVIYNNNQGYIYNGSTISTISTGFTPSWMGWVDGYLPTIEKDSGRFWINETAYDYSTWNSLDFSTAEGSPDYLVWGIVDKREIILFGQQSTEIYYNSGNADFPFERVPNGYIETGIYSEWAAGKIGNAVFFLGNDGVAYILNGYVPQRISNHAFEQAVDGYSGDCNVFTWHESGHAMVAFQFSQGCWVYDMSTQLWHNRKTYKKDTWDVKFITQAFHDYFVGGPTLGRLDPNVFTEYGDTLRLRCTSSNLNDKGNIIYHDRLEMIFETGGGDAQVMLRYSDDGGRTWSSEIWEGMGDLGNYKDRVIFHQLGSARNRVYEYSISDAFPRTLMQATLNEWN